MHRPRELWRGGRERAARALDKADLADQLWMVDRASAQPDELGRFARLPAAPAGYQAPLIRSGHRRPRTLQMCTGRASPFSATGPICSASIMFSTAPATRAEIKISPPAASPQSRAARFVTVPIAP